MSRKPMETPEEWREGLGIIIGMTKEEALNKFIEWQGKKKTCQRCQEELYQYRIFCQIRSVCEEAENGKSKDRPIIFREKSGHSIRNIEIESLRTAPKRASLDKPGG